MRFLLRIPAATLAIMLFAACNGSKPTVPGDLRLPLGTWGGDNAAVIAVDSLTHVHVGCTNGYFPNRVALNEDGSFKQEGSYHLHVYPVAFGPPMPALFSGSVDGAKLTFVVTVQDTIERKTVTLGPSTVVLGTEPRMGPCPICTAPLFSRKQ